MGLNAETPLGHTVQIRSEKDQKKINSMTNQEKKMRKEWFDFKREKSSKNKSEKIYISKDQINSVFSKIFK